MPYTHAAQYCEEVWTFPVGLCATFSIKNGMIKKCAA